MLRAHSAAELANSAGTTLSFSWGEQARMKVLLFHRRVFPAILKAMAIVQRRPDEIGPTLSPGDRQRFTAPTDKTNGSPNSTRVVMALKKRTNLWGVPFLTPYTCHG